MVIFSRLSDRFAKSTRNDGVLQGILIGSHVISSIIAFTTPGI